MGIKRDLSKPLSPSVFDGPGNGKKKRKKRRENRKFLKEQHESPVRRRDLDKKGKKLYDSINKKRKRIKKADRIQSRALRIYDRGNEKKAHKLLDKENKLREKQ